MRLGTLFTISTMILIALIGGMLTRIILVEWDSYRSTTDALAAMRLAQEALVAAEKVSFERGPTNGVLGDGDAPDAVKRSQLAAARNASDTALGEALGGLGGDAATKSGDAVDDLHRAVALLAQARVEVDRVAALPKAERSDERLMAAINQMFGVIPAIMRAATQLSKQATDIYPQFGDPMVAARLAAELREYSGQLGSLFTPVLTEQKPMSEAAKQNVVFLRGRIEELHQLLLLRMGGGYSHGRISDTVRRMEEDYFIAGLDLVAQLERSSASGQLYGMDTATFAGRYVPKMASLVRLRDDLIAEAIDGATAQHAEARRTLVVVAVAGLGAMMVVVLLFLIVHRRVVRPLLGATRLIVDIAHGELDAAVPEASRPDEIGDMLRAVAKLKDNSLAKRRLEEERQCLIGELKRSNAELEQFAYVASHDLRQPLRMVGSYVGLIEKRLGNDIDADMKDFVGYAKDGARRMDTLIVGLLQYSRAGRSKASWQDVALDDVMAQVAHDLQLAIGDSGATITVAEGLPHVVGDAMEMTRLFQNLIGNAIKYHAPDRAPMVSIAWQDDGDQWRISVADNGIGIAPDQYERAFGIFQRLVTQEQYEGTGIGLAVSKKIAEHHGGRIWMESTPGEGTTLLVSLPKIAS